jgi:hypothetical protein
MTGATFICTAISGGPGVEGALEESAPAQPEVAIAHCQARAVQPAGNFG